MFPHEVPFSGWSGEHFISQLSRLHSIQCLILPTGTFSVEHGGPGQIAKFHHLSKLTKLDASSTYMNTSTCAELSALYDLRHLNLSDNLMEMVVYTKDQARPLLDDQLVISLQHLTFLDMSNNNGLDGDTMIQFASCLPSLCHLDVGKCDGILTLNSLIELQPLTRMSHLGLRYAAFETDTIVHHMFSLTQLSSLDLTHASVGTHDALPLNFFHGLTHIQSLCIGHTLSAVNCVVLGQSLVKFPTITHLRLNNIYVMNSLHVCITNILKPLSLSHLATTLFSLDLSGNHVILTQKHGNILTKFQRLTSLDISHNHIHVHLWVSICTMRSLKQLRVRSSDVKDTHIHDLTRLTSLEELDVSNNRCIRVLSILYVAKSLPLLKQVKVDMTMLPRTKCPIEECQLIDLLHSRA